MSLLNSLSRRILNDVSIMCLDDWCDIDRHKAEFTPASAAMRAVPVDHKYICNLTCYHNDNFVSARGTGPCTGDAFLAALRQIEMTIGTKWRNY